MNSVATAVRDWRSSPAHPPPSVGRLLDGSALKAFELRLVKQIVVANAAGSGGANDAFVRVEDITHKPSVRAKLRIHMQTPEGPKEKSVSVKNGDDLLYRSNERAAYAQG